MGTLGSRCARLKASKVSSKRRPGAGQALGHTGMAKTVGCLRRRAKRIVWASMYAVSPVVNMYRIPEKKPILELVERVSTLEETVLEGRAHLKLRTGTARKRAAAAAYHQYLEMGAEFSGCCIRGVSAFGAIGTLAAGAASMAPGAGLGSKGTVAPCSTGGWGRGGGGGG